MLSEARTADISSTDKLSFDRSPVLTRMSEEAMDAGIEIKVEEYDGNL